MGRAGWENGKRGKEPVGAMVREAREETGLEIKPSELEYLGKVFVRYPDYDFVYHMLRTKLPTKHSVKLSPKEHQDFRWMAPRKSLKMNLVDDLGECIKMFYQSTLPK